MGKGKNSKPISVKRILLLGSGSRVFMLKKDQYIINADRAQWVGLAI